MCELCNKKVQYFGHIIEPGRLSIYDDIVKALEEAENPRKNQELSSFLGIFIFYILFVCLYNNIFAPLK